MFIPLCNLSFFILFTQFSTFADGHSDKNGYISSNSSSISCQSGNNSNGCTFIVICKCPTIPLFSQCPHGDTGNENGVDDDKDDDVDDDLADNDGDDL